MIEDPYSIPAADSNTFFIRQPPPIAGEYEIGQDSGLAIHIRNKPSAWTRFWMRTLLDWRWTDAE